MFKKPQKQSLLKLLPAVTDTKPPYAKPKGMESICSLSTNTVL